MIEDDLDVERVVQPEGVVPHRAAEDQVVDGPVSLKFWKKGISVALSPLNKKTKARFAIKCRFSFLIWQEQVIIKMLIF